MFKLTIFIGVVAAVAWALPDLVLLGMFLIVPGIILVLAPTVFAYLVAASGLRSILPLGSGVKGTTAALAAAGLLGCLVPLPFQWIGVNKFQAAIQQDVGTNTPLQLSGHILLERGDVQHWKRDEERSCDELCAALLQMPAIKSVTLAKGKQLESVTNWRLVPHGSVVDRGLAPTNPAHIFSHDPPGSLRDFTQLAAKRDALSAEWNLRLATTDTLVASQVTPLADLTITITDRRERSKPTVQRVEIRDRAGKTLLRRSLVQHAVVAAPFLFDFDASMHGSKFRIGRKRLSTGDRYQDFNAITVLLVHVSGLRQSPSLDVPHQVRQRLTAALDKPEGNPRDLALARPWINSRGYRFASKDDENLFRRVIADLRVQFVGQAMRNLHPKYAPIEYRPMLVRRIIAPETNAKDRQHFALLLSKMPSGTFAEMTDAEWEIINAPSLWIDSAPFIQRLADLGQPGTEPLVKILKYAVALPDWQQRKPIVRAVGEGFCRLGTDAGDALPWVRELFQQSRCPITNSSDDALIWRTAMARMGTPIEALPFPPSWSEQQIRKSQAAISRRLANFDSDAEGA